MTNLRTAGALRIGGSAIVGLVLLFLVAPPLAAQERATTGTWLPWAGCWEGTGELAAEEAGDAMLCVRPAEDPVAAELLTVVEGEIASSETIHADGSARRVSREGCQGTRTARFSEDGARIFVRSDLTCEGGVARVTSGVMSMATPHQWIDVQAVEVADRADAWVRRYRLADRERVEAAGLSGIAADRRMSVEAARFSAARAPRVEDVIDAAEHVHPEVLKAWIAEQGDPFHLDADRLVRMAEAGVAEDVIDVVVAVSYPDRFTLGEEPSRIRPYDERADYDRYDRRRSYGAGFHYGRPYYGYPFGYRYSPFGYGWYGGSYGFYGYRPRVIVVQPRDDGGGRVVNGRGYRSGGSSSSGAVRGSSPAPSSSSGGIRSGSSGGGSGAAITPSGASSGGSSTGRKARKKGGGGGDDGGGLFD